MSNTWLKREENMKVTFTKRENETEIDFAEEALTELKMCPNGAFRLVKGLKIDSKEIEGGRCMRGSDRKLCFSEKERGKVWKDYMERNMYQ